MAQKFEAAIYNEDVAAALRDGSHHKDLSDDWAETHYIEFHAASMDAAWDKMRQKYRAGQGFIIKAIDVVD
jgi:hypothetical protein